MRQHYRIQVLQKTNLITQSFVQRVENMYHYRIQIDMLDY
jgi:hypothetical protein